MTDVTAAAPAAPAPAPATASSIHPVANVGLSTVGAGAITTLIVYLASLGGVTVPANVVEAITTLTAIGIAYAIHANTQVAQS